MINVKVVNEMTISKAKTTIDAKLYIAAFDIDPCNIITIELTTVASCLNLEAVPYVVTIRNFGTVVAL